MRRGGRLTPNRNISKHGWIAVCSRMYDAKYGAAVGNAEATIGNGSKFALLNAVRYASIADCPI